MTTPVILYTTAGGPIGARAYIQFYRPPTTTDALGNAVASVVPFGSETNGTAVGGSTVIEDITLDLPGGLVARMGTYGEDRDKAIVRKAPTLNMTAQMAGLGTPTLCPGDYCAISIGWTITSTTASPVQIPTTRWFLDADSITMNQNQFNKFGLKLQFDRDNSSPNLIQF